MRPARGYPDILRAFPGIAQDPGTDRSFSKKTSKTEHSKDDGRHGLVFSKPQ
jgi:hypothetical protein